MHGLFRCNINTDVHARAGEADVSLRDFIIAHIGSGITECGWRHAPEECGGFGEILKKSESWDETCFGRRRLAFACSRRPLWRVPHVLGGGRWKSQNRKIVLLPPYVEEPLNSKVIKSFVPEQRNRQVFFVFRDPMFYVICYIYNEHSMYISHIHVYGHGTVAEGCINGCTQ